MTTKQILERLIREVEYVKQTLCTEDLYEIRGKIKMCGVLGVISAEDYIRLLEDTENIKVIEGR